MIEFQEVAQLIESNIENSTVKINDLTGTQDHLGILVISQAFEGKTLIDQHQMVMDVLKERLKDDIHAVQIKTLTPEKAVKKGFLPENS